MMIKMMMIMITMKIFISYLKLCSPLIYNTARDIINIPADRYVIYNVGAIECR